MEQNNNLIKMTPQDAAEFMWSCLTTKKRYDFIVASSDDFDTDATIYCCTMILVAGHATVVANAYGGGDPFAYEVPLFGKFAPESFKNAFSGYLTNLGGDIWVNSIPMEEEPPVKADPVTMRIQDFAHTLNTNIDSPTTVRFSKDVNAAAPFTTEVYTFHYYSVADSIIAICNSDKGGKLFYHDVSSSHGCVAFVDAFTKYLKDCGFNSSVQAFI